MAEQIDLSYKEDIVATRKGGFGSSDAAIILKLSEGEELNKTDRMRIAEMLGLREHKEFHSWKIDRGNEYEQYAFQAMQMVYPNAVSNPYYNSEEKSKKYGFNIFNHIDMEVESEKDLIWFEMKTSSIEVADVIHKYSPQLAWHWMLLDEKAKALGKKPKLMLLFHPMYADFDINLLQKISIERIPNNFDAGFERMQELLKDFTWDESKEVLEDMPDELVFLISEFLDKREKAQKTKKAMDDAQKDLMEAMEKYCLPKEINSIPIGDKKITYISGSTRFEESIQYHRLKEELPDVYKKYLKEEVDIVFDDLAFKQNEPELAAEFISKEKKVKNPSIQIR